MWLGQEIETLLRMSGDGATDWNGAVVRTWLDARIAAARLDQVVAERGGRERQDDCDKATAEEMVCTLLLRKTDGQSGFADAVRAVLERDEYLWRGVYDDRRFDRHVRTFAKKLARMAKTNSGFGNVAHYQ